MVVTTQVERNHQAAAAAAAAQAFSSDEEDMSDLTLPGVGSFGKAVSGRTCAFSFCATISFIGHNVPSLL